MDCKRRQFWLHLFFILFAALIVLTMSMAAEQSDLVMRNGRIVTVDAGFSQAEAVAVRNGRIVFVGSNQDVAAWIGPATRVIDLNGRTVLPGLIDAHAHLYDLGKELSELRVTSTSSFSEIVERVARRVNVSRPGEWIVGGRWDQNDWVEKEFPVHESLSRVSPQNPVFLKRVDGNAAMVNRRALQIAGIDRNTPDPAGGRIIRDKQGEATGVLVNRAMVQVLSLIPAEADDQIEKKLLVAASDCLQKGLTGVHDAGVGPALIAIYKKLIDSDRLPIRIYAMLGDERDPEPSGDIRLYLCRNKVLDYRNRGLLSVRSVKLFFDGALGSRGAAFFEPYLDDPANSGLLRISPETIYRITRAALQEGMGVNTHCIGIRGNRLCLAAYEKALGEVPVQDHRLRIEHAQIVQREDVAVFKRLGVIPAMQPIHCTSDMSFVDKRIGAKRSEGAYAWRWFRQAGLVIPCGSDFPVETNDPLQGIYAAVTRQDESGLPVGGWHAEQRLSREEAIRGYTIWAAQAAFQEKQLGSIETGKRADFVVFDKDLLHIQPSEILTAKVDYTILEGKIVYQRK
jgi:hypothetical protein